MPFKHVRPESLFKCQKCGDCCKGYGGTYVTEEDIADISRFVGTTPEKFKKAYCWMSGNKPLIKQKSDGYCIFWDKICTIHPVKPKMCRELNRWLNFCYCTIWEAVTIWMMWWTLRIRSLG